MKPVVIVGGGLAGLTCARALKRRRIPFLILEAEDRIGGRVKTDSVGDFHLDRGYQVYFTAYAHAKDQIDEDRLKLRKFEGGAIVVWDGDQHMVGGENPIQFALSGFLSAGDKLRLGKWTSDVQWMDQEDINDVTDRTSEQYLRDEGFSEDFLDRFARPFFGGVFLDRTLSTSCRQLLFVWKAVTQGQTTIPALGMEEIPKQFATTFGSDVLQVNTRVVEVLKNEGKISGVLLASGEIVEADHVVLACDAKQAGELSGIATHAGFHSSITLYFTAPESVVKGALIVLNGNVRGITNHVVPLSNLDSPDVQGEKKLIAAVILGNRAETDEQLADIVRSEMRVWFPAHDVEEWRFLRAYRSDNAQMVQQPNFQKALPGNDSGVSGLYFAGEFTTNSSIDGAVRSGLECAELILSRVVAGVA
jgi:protoporphyrinogen oxidase